MAHPAALSTPSLSTARCAALRGLQTPCLGRHGGWAECKRRGQRAAFGTTVVSMASSIQFIKGIKEPSVPDVKLTRARDGSSGTAQFTFNQPSVFEASSDLGDITGLYLVDDEGTLQTVDVQAKFVNGKPDRIEAKYVMRSSFEWDRFMRFMERYADENELGFTKRQGQQ